MAGTVRRWQAAIDVVDDHQVAFDERPQDTAVVIVHLRRHGLGGVLRAGHELHQLGR